MYCDMCDRKLWPLCGAGTAKSLNGTATTYNCFDLLNNQLRLPGMNIRRGGASPVKRSHSVQSKDFCFTLSQSIIWINMILSSMDTCICKVSSDEFKIGYRSQYFFKFFFFFR